MPRRPEIGNIQLYPNRPLKKSDRNGYVLKFYCPIQQARIRRNCGSRDRREARRILRECRERLLNGDYESSNGAIIAAHEVRQAHAVVVASVAEPACDMSWQDAYHRYRNYKKTRVRPKSLTDLCSRLNISERILEGYREDRGLTPGLPLAEVFTVYMLEYLQDRLLAGDECRYDDRAASTVNGVIAGVLAFAKHCLRHSWITSVPFIEKLNVDNAMKGRPITLEELERIEVVLPHVVGILSTPSWKFALRVLWESGFRIGDLMDFSWDDELHIHPVWPKRQGQHPTIIIPSTQKNGRNEEIPMLPGLRELLESVPKRERTGWVVNPVPIQSKFTHERFQPTCKDLELLVGGHTNTAIATACGVSEMAVRKWLVESNVVRSTGSRSSGLISATEIERLRANAATQLVAKANEGERLTKERVGRLICWAGEKAGVVVVKADEERNRRCKFASAHDLRRGCALRLIDSGVSAETLKVVMRHRSFATTEKFYAATRSAQSAAAELLKISAAQNPSLVGGLVGGPEVQPQLSNAEILKLRSILEAI